MFLLSSCGTDYATAFSSYSINDKERISVLDEAKVFKENISALKFFDKYKVDNSISPIRDSEEMIEY